MTKSPEAFRTISEVAELLDVPAHVLRFWETRFTQVKPVKRGGGRRYYRPDDVRLLRGIRGLLYDNGLTIKGVQKILREQGVRYVIGLGTVDEREAPALVVAGGVASPRQGDLLGDIVAAVAHGNRRAAEPVAANAKGKGMAEHAGEARTAEAEAEDAGGPPARSIDRDALRRLVAELEALRRVMVSGKDA
jgi:DNA-binding transcriptional MerR regulator